MKAQFYLWGIQYKNGVPVEFEKPVFKDPYAGYEDYLYTGLQGFFMAQNHKRLSRGIQASQNKKILEVGGGRSPHCSQISLNNVHQYIVSDSASTFLDPKSEQLLAKHRIEKHVYTDDPGYDSLHAKGCKFTRIIASHVWEHIADPESALLSWVNLLEDDGIIDIAIPCDPGLSWRLGQLLGRQKALRKYHMTPAELDLFYAREHINSARNLVSIVKYYTGMRGIYYPIKIPLIDLNLFIFFRLRKSDFRQL